MKINRDVVVLKICRMFMPILSSTWAINKARNKFLWKENKKIRQFAVICFCCENCL